MRVLRSAVVAVVLTAGALVAAEAVAGAQPATGRPADVLEVPYCPEAAPQDGEYLGSAVVGGHHLDYYKVPNLFGFKFVQVTCD
ncbi:hypothetical protein [Actinosynnema sp. NPDC020468]|uniref:hypothetical protein n=1 Tax=Actinosynnema sp. NPDC020468 TaxID=3154488 RepID=UPI00340BC2F7